MMMSLWQLYMLAILILIGIGIYCLLARKNIIQLVIGIEVIAKGVTLSFILAGFLQGNEQIAQAIVITIIFIEVITAAIALSLIVVAHRHTGSLDVKDIRRLWG
jgi:multisubunit Na+/H+ antiporter MnhC subunit